MGQAEPSVCGQQGQNRTGTEAGGQTARYQVYVHSGVAQGSPAAVARYHPTPDLAHGLLRYQINGEVLVHLEQDRQERSHRHVQTLNVLAEFQSV